MTVHITSGQQSQGTLVIIYQPDSPPCMEFFSELSDLLARHIMTPNLVVAGDFNIHVDDISDNHRKELLELLASMGLEQHVRSPTHTGGHTLDLIISRESDQLISPTSVAVSDYISDHAAVHCVLNLDKPRPTKKVTQYRKLTSIDGTAFKSDLQRLSVLTSPENDISALVDQYSRDLSRLVDKHAPLRSRVLRIRPHAPWFTEEIAQAKVKRRQYEALWRKSGLTVHREMFKTQRQTVQDLIKASKREYFSQLVTNAPSPKALFGVIDKLLHRKRPTPLPEHQSATDLANRFSTFFHTKIADIHKYLDELSITATPTLPARPRTSDLVQFSAVSEQDIMKLIRKSPAKSCSLDPIPTSLLMAHSDTLLPAITRIVNTSLTTGMFPTQLKEAHVTPLLKKPSLDSEVLKNFRPVSNLSFVSKIVEKAVAVQLSRHLQENDLHEPSQSAYRPVHSTETALLRIKSDILQALDKKETVFLVLLDLSSAFDTIDHSILLTTLEEQFGICGQALAWFRSYLANRFQTVRVNGSASSKQKLSCGVPQGSVLGPQLFTMYSSPIAQIARKHGLSVQLYADDTQLYLAFKPLGSIPAIEKVEHCVSEMRTWMVVHRLMLNQDKTVILHLIRQRGDAFTGTINIAGSEISTSPIGRNLGVLMDDHLNMKAHVSQVCRSSYMHIRDIGAIRKMLTRRATETLVHAFITSRLDYCNSLLYGHPAVTINKLQRIQNTAARIVTCTRKREHITPILQELHWLPVAQRITYKLLTLTYQALHGQAPVYLQELTVPYRPGRSLRSADCNWLVVPPSRLKTCGDRSFAVAGPTLWNSLSQTIRAAESLSQFKKLLKTHLYIQAYYQR